MDRGDVLSGDAFTAVLRSAFAFVVVLLLFGWAALTYVERSLISELSADVQLRWNILAAEHASDGQEHVVETIDHVTNISSNGHHGTALFHEERGLVAGNILTPPEEPGLQVGPLDHAAASEEDVTRHYVYFSGPLDGHVMVVAQRLDLLYHTQILVFRTLTLSGFLIVLTMLAFGYFLSQRSLRRLRDIEVALSKTSEGDTTTRIPDHGNSTQIDRIANEINRHLDRLSRMIATTRNTAAAAAHDLKSPLGRAYLSLETAMERVNQGDDPSEALTDTQEELERMRVIFDSYLQLSRIESAGDEHLAGEVDLKTLLEELVDTFALIAEDENQSLTFDVDNTQDFRVAGDGQMLQQLAVNLFQNAIAYGAPGNQIQVALHRDDQRIRFLVADTGPGIPSDAKERVFEPFHRLDPSRTKPGSGLGLALVQAIAEKHRSNVTLNDNDPGLIVEVTLPALH